MFSLVALLPRVCVPYFFSHVFFSVRLYSLIFCLYFIDVPDAPERPLITSFTSRSMNLSWAHSQEPRNAPVTHFLVETR